MGRKGLIKKILKKSLVVVGVTVLSGVVVAGTFAAVKEIQCQPKKSQIDYLMNACDVKDINMSNRLPIIFEEPTKPIKYYFDENYPEQCAELTRKVLDKIYGYISEVNPNYTYEIVSDKSAADTIYLTGDLSSKNSKYSEGGRPNGMVKDNPYKSYFLIRNKTSIIIDYDYFAQGFNNYGINLEDYKTALLQNSIMHETLHSFGFADLYGTAADVMILGSVMNDEGRIGVECKYLSDYGEDVINKPIDYCELSVNDYANLIIDTAPVVDKDQLPNLANTINSKIKEYELARVSKIEKMTNDYQLQKIEKSLKLKIDEEYLKCEKHDAVERIDGKITHSYPNEEYKISINDSKYKVKMIQEDGTADFCEGKVDRLNNNLIVLRNVTTHFRPNGYVSEVEHRDSVMYDVVIAKVNDEYLIFTDYNDLRYGKLSNLVDVADLSI